MFVFTCLTLLIGFPVAFTLSGSALAVVALGSVLGLIDASYLLAVPQRLFGIMTNEVLIAVPVFIFMGVMLERSKVAEEMLETMGSLFGRRSGGLCYSVMLVGMLMAASTGIVGATVVTMGLLALPVMLKWGYDRRLACGSICAAGTLGQIIPPSIVLILLGDVISAAYQEAQYKQGIFATETVSVGDLFAGALLPGLLLVAVYLTYQLIVITLCPEKGPSTREASKDVGHHFARKLFHALVFPLALILAVLGSILFGIATPTEAASVGAVGAVLLANQRLCREQGRSARSCYLAGSSIVVLVVLNAIFDLRVSRESMAYFDGVGIILALPVAATLFLALGRCLVQLHKGGIVADVCRRTLEMTSMVFLILIGATVFSLVFRALGGDDMVHRYLTALPGEVGVKIAVVMAVMFVLGFFLEYIEITFVVIPIVAPVLLSLGVDPVWLGILMALNLQTSFLTPPFGFSLFYLRGVAPKSIATADIYYGIMPFIAIQVLVIFIVAVFPAIATWLPDRIYG